MTEIFSFLKSGQPSAFPVVDGDWMMSHWYCKGRQYKAIATHMSLDGMKLH